MGDVAVVVGAPAPDGRGMCTLSAPIDLPEEFVWKRLVHKAYHFEEYFTTAELSLEVLPDGRLYRNLVIDDPVRAPKMGRTRVIDIFRVDKEAGDIEFQELDSATEQPTGDTRYNILHRNPLRIEYSTLSPEGVKRPLSNGGPIKQQIKEAYDAWRSSGSTGVGKGDAWSGEDEGLRKESKNVPQSDEGEMIQGEKVQSEKAQGEKEERAVGEDRSLSTERKGVKRTLGSRGASPSHKKVDMQRSDGNKSDGGEDYSALRKGDSPNDVA